jgi:mono/diheme cytochrome c family protein
MYATKHFIHLFFVFVFFAGSVAIQAQSNDKAKVDTAAKATQGTSGDATTPAGDPKLATVVGDAALGKEIFVGQCKQCHAITDEVVVGPGLKNVDQRHSESWLIKWIKNSSKMVASGDAEAVAIYNKYQKQAMPSFENLKDSDVKAILAYVKIGEQAAGPAVGDNSKPSVDGTAQASGGGVSSEYFNIILFSLVVVLLLVLAVLLLMATLMTRLLNDRKDLSEDDKEIVNLTFDFNKILTSRPLLAGLGVLAFLVFTKVGLDSVMHIGMTQGYAPKQPIAFSHKLHAGKYEIGCQYCHTTVYKAKGASIPSANICMNCHNAIKQGSPEIKKIYTAIEKDQPIEWVRVHNLPDHAYFNHAQHTNVGGLECINCHGEINKMEVVQQYSPLTMGWCIDCHRKTSVNAKDNAYYDKLLEMHNSTEKGEMKVVYIGGLECSKCHY